DTIVAMRTFKVTAAPAISATPPEDLTLGTCLSQDSVNAAYDAWAASGVVEGGCGLVVDIDKPAAPDACGGEVVVTWTISSDCADTIVAMRTFKVTAAPAISATPPEDLTLGTCLSQDSVNAAYDAWAASGVVEGGCGLVVDIDKPAAPDACGGEVVITWTISSDCADTIVAMRTFKVTPDLEAPVIAAPDDYDLCNGELPKFIVAEWTDNCLGAGVDTAWMQPREDDDICTETADYFFMVQDSCGNVAMDTTTIVNRTDKYENCETAFAKIDGEGANCFLDNGFNRWGWSNYIETGGQDTSVTLALWAGAAHCETEKGAYVGTVEVTYDAVGKTVTVEYLIAEGYAMSEAHTYVGCGMFPLQKKGKTYVPTVAPGQFTANAGSLEHSNNIIVTFSNVVEENFYVIAHAVTCEEVCTCTAGPGVDDGNTYNAVFDNMNCEDTNVSSTSEENTKNKKSVDTVLPQTIESAMKVYPNPFSDQVNIEFVSPVSGHAVLEIHNITGQRVATLMDKYIEAGVEQKVKYRPESAASGIYLYKLNIDGNIKVGKIIYRNK
ncbi:T9SS type A sorting domain-containing protein, partial [Maribellus sp. YY47]|uniref:T9SS type A sorting domain-containing protein n=1 Tax=Maribellus sp. YY47 TaxID=2929486 RepID=UPI00200096E3